MGQGCDIAHGDVQGQQQWMDMSLINFSMNLKNTAS